MIECKFLQDTICLKASIMANARVCTSEGACKVCLAEPDRDNHVTASLALGAIPRPVPEDKQYLYQLIKKEKLPEAPDGPGTELRKLISWFIWDRKVKNCSICKNREERMNRWGPDTCLKNIVTIIEWLRESAKEKGYPFSERIAHVLVKKAITNSRK